MSSVTNIETLNNLIGKDDPTQLAVLNSDTPHVQVALAVTREKGLEVSVLDHREIYREERAALPARIEGTRTVSELTSFLDELTRFPLTPGTATLWGDHTKGRVIAIYNDHTADNAAHRDNKLVLQLTPDVDWTAWHALSGKFFPQEEFGDKIEELLHTIIEPDQADLLEIIDTVRATSSAAFESRINRSDGSQTIGYSEEISSSAGGKSSGQLEVPKTVLLRLRPWEGQVETYDVPAWFRLRVGGGSLALCIKLKPTAQLLRTAWEDTVSKIIEHTGIPVLAHRNQS